MTHPDQEARAAFEAWWFDPASADNSKRYTLTVDDMRRMAEDVTWKSWQAALEWQRCQSAGADSQEKEGR